MKWRTELNNESTPQLEEECLIVTKYRRIDAARWSGAHFTLPRGNDAWEARPILIFPNETLCWIPVLEIVESLPDSVIEKLYNKF